MKFRAVFSQNGETDFSDDSPHFVEIEDIKKTGNDNDVLGHHESWAAAVGLALASAETYGYELVSIESV